MNDNACVSILTPNFNRANLYIETLDSLRAQTHQEWENIVVDDGSAAEAFDELAEICERDERVKLYSRDRDPKGACTCRNIGVGLSRGDYVVFLDTDDLLAPHCLAQRVRVMEENPELDFAIFPSTIFRETPGDLGLWWNIDTGEDLLVRQFHQDAICQGTGVIWKKSSFERIGMWDERLAIWQDIDLFLRAFIQGYRYKVCFDLEPDLHYRRHATSLSSAGFFARHKLESRIQVLHRAVELLEQNGREADRPLARFMTGETATGSARSGNHDLARDLIQWGHEHEVLTTTDAAILRRACLAHRFRLNRLNFVARHLDRRLHRFHAVTRLGQMPTTTALVTTPEDGMTAAKMIAENTEASA